LHLIKHDVFTFKRIKFNTSSTKYFLISCMLQKHFNDLLIFFLTLIHHNYIISLFSLFFFSQSHLQIWLKFNSNFCTLLEQIKFKRYKNCDHFWAKYRTLKFTDSWVFDSLSSFRIVITANNHLSFLTNCQSRTSKSMNHSQNSDQTNKLGSYYLLSYFPQFCRVGFHLEFIFRSLECPFILCHSLLHAYFTVLFLQNIHFK